VTDRGPGVDKDHLEKIFEPFYRVSDSRSRESGGSGLGLAIARRAIERHHGRISARNLDTGGLMISVELPTNKGC
jgi:two-component system sensor histidine kinase CpxA